MVGTIMIHGSNGEVMAPIGGGQFIRGKRLDIRVVRPPKDEDVPMSVREALVGMTISTIFSSEQLHGAAPPKSRMAYGREVVEALEKAGKETEAQELSEALNKTENGEYTLLVFERPVFEFVEDNNSK